MCARGRHDKTPVMSCVFVTGTAGFICFHLAKLLLEEGAVVHGSHEMTDYYEVSLKRQWDAILSEGPNYTYIEGMVEDSHRMETVIDEFRPDKIIHLVAYGLATGCLMVLAKLRPWLAALMLFAFGVTIEFIQPSVGRETHVEDVLANTLGIVTAWCLVAFWRRLTMRRRVTSTRVDW